MYHYRYPTATSEKGLIDTKGQNLCWLCQKNSTAVIRNANQPEAQKTEVIYQQITLCQNYNH